MYLSINQKFFKLCKKCNNHQAFPLCGGGGNATLLLTLLLQVVLLCNFQSLQAQACGSLSFQAGPSYSGGHTLNVVWDGSPTNFYGANISLDLVTSNGANVEFDKSLTENSLSASVQAVFLTSSLSVTTNNTGSSTAGMNNRVSLNLFSGIPVTLTQNNTAGGVILFTMFINAIPNSCYGIAPVAGGVRCITNLQPPSASFCNITYTLLPETAPLQPFVCVRNCFSLSANIRGRVEYLNNPTVCFGVGNVAINMSNPNSNPVVAYCNNPQTLTLSPSGLYSSCDLMPNNNCLVRPKHTAIGNFEDASYRLACGISTFDLVRIRKHILQVEPFTQAWQFLAADIDQSGSVTTFDMVLLRKAILVIDSLPYRWRFVPKSPQYGSYEINFLATPPNQAPLLYQNFHALGLLPPTALVNLVQGTNPKDFVAVKMGDVAGGATINGLETGNGNCPCDASQFGENTDQIAEPIIKNSVKNLEVQEFNTLGVQQYYKVPVRLSALETADMSVYSIGLFVDPNYFDLKAVQAGNYPDADQLEWVEDANKKGFYRILWVATKKEGVSLQGGDVVFTLSLYAKQPTASIAGLIDIQSSYFDSAIYPPRGSDVADVQLQVVGNATPPPAITVSPNPFQQETKVTYENEQLGDVVFTVSDPMGNIVYNKTDLNVDAGTKTHLLSLSGIPMGTYMLRVKTSTAILTANITKIP